MSNNEMYDYDQVRIVINDEAVTAESNEDQVVDLTFHWQNLNAKLPVIFFYNGSEVDERVETICREAGVLTCGAAGSAIPFLTADLVDPKDEPLNLLYETLNPVSKSEMNKLRYLSKNNLVVGCSVSAKHAEIIANEKLASAILVGPTQSTTFKEIDTMGIATPRVSLVSKLSESCDLPIFVTAGSAAETCKALVAGADAVVINIGGPFSPDEDVKFVVDAVTQSLHENIQQLCKLSNVTSHKFLRRTCKIVPAR
jgi:aspartate-semialdehyde dehydrogenase